MWTKGSIEIDGVEVVFEMKHFEQPSAFGINQGRISKLTLWIDGKEVLNYDRGWDIRPTSSVVHHALQKLLKRYN
ncbi:hypothetical protein [Lactococcus lactis]|uniref:DUF7678 domain-containing protein n=1 Tax=Lactococcus lactis subsp. lactis A12 TaxID=1137134 RepID=S6F4M0_LACLL|nr:hypothetical protein [Lactococcus lactis]CDG03754.1 Putative uncharacterized protein [Lactococcus lactis subsp. lactis A12]SBW29593.1 Putative uncharacterized protein [Lactococcus lactis subsp. lactis]